jgi:hypothetical protein
MKEEKDSLWKFSGKIISAVLVTVISTIVLGMCKGWFEYKSDNEQIVESTFLAGQERDKKIIAALELYTTDLNQKKFDAYKYFAPKIERFFHMFDTSPKKINDYVNGMFYKQFQNASTRFDPNTLIVTTIDNVEYDISVIMYSTYFNAKEKKAYSDLRTRTEIKLDKNFRIKYLKQFFD